MNRRFLQLLMLVVIISLLVACSNEHENPDVVVSTNETGDTEVVPEEELRLTISLDNGAQFINEEQIQLDEEASLLKIMRDTFFIETDEENEIRIIERMEANEDEGITWHLYIDDEPTDVSPEDYVPNGGEKIVFDLH